MKRKATLSTVFSFILSLFLALCLLAGNLCIYARSTLCEQPLLTNTLLESGYCRQLYEEILYKWENLLSICGVPETENETILQVLTPEGVKQDTLAYFEASYTGAPELDTQALEEGLEALIRSYAYKSDVSLSSQEELDRNITDLVDACMQDYHSCIQVPLMPRLLRKIAPLSQVLQWGILASGVGALALGVFLFFLQRKRADTLYYLGISVGSNAALILILYAFINGAQLIYRLPITESALRTFLLSYLGKLLEQFLLLGLCLLGIAAALGLSYFLISSLKRKKA